MARNLAQIHFCLLSEWIQGQCDQLLSSIRKLRKISYDLHFMHDLNFMANCRDYLHGIY